MKNDSTLAAIVLALAAVPALAQSGPSLLIKPWQGDQLFEFTGSALVPAESHTHDSSLLANSVDIQVSQYEASGRGRLDPDDPMKISFGFSMDVLDFDEHPDAANQTLFHHLADQSIAAGVGITEIDGWKIGVIAGLGFGYTGDDSEVVDQTAFYAKGDVIVSRDVDDKSTLTFVLDYNRNRSLFPDAPFPAVLYTHEFSPEFGCRLGFPEDGFWWKPVEGLNIDFDYIFPYTVDAEASYELVKSLSVFGRYENDFDCFLVDDDQQNRRIFFEKQRLEAGLKWKVIGQVDLILAGGYLLGQKVSDGWDARSTDTIFKIGDAPYIRLGITASF